MDCLRNHLARRNAQLLPLVFRAGGYLASTRDPAVGRYHRFTLQVLKNLRRRSGESYSFHPYAVLGRLLDFPAYRADAEMSISALTHDLIESAGPLLEQIRTEIAQADGSPSAYQALLDDPDRRFFRRFLQQEFGAPEGRKKFQAFIGSPADMLEMLAPDQDLTLALEKQIGLCLEKLDPRWGKEVRARTERLSRSHYRGGSRREEEEAYNTRFRNERIKLSRRIKDADLKAADVETNALTHTFERIDLPPTALGGRVIGKIEASQAKYHRLMEVLNEVPGTTYFTVKALSALDDADSCLAEFQAIYRTQDTLAASPPPRPAGIPCPTRQNTIETADSTPYPL